MNTTSTARPWLWLAAVPLMLLALTATIPGAADAAAPATRKPAAAKKTATATLAPNVRKNNSALGKTAKKHHKHHHKHHHRHHHRHHHKHKHHKTNASNTNQVSQDLARVQQDEKTLDRDVSRLRRALR